VTVVKYNEHVGYTGTSTTALLHGDGHASATEDLSRRLVGNAKEIGEKDRKLVFRRRRIWFRDVDVARASGLPAMPDSTAVAKGSSTGDVHLLHNTGLEICTESGRRKGS
jgi:hypothetical protein